MLKTTKTGPTYKLVDFGLATIIEPGQKLKDLVGTRYYVAPEIIKGEQYDGQAADIWSLGITLFVALMEELPV